MNRHLIVIILLQSSILFTAQAAFSQHPVKNIAPSFATKIPPGPWCLILINNRHYTINCKLIDSLIKPKSIKSLKVATAESGAAIYGYRAGNGIVIVEIKKQYWKREFPRLSPYIEKL